MIPFSHCLRLRFRLRYLLMLTAVVACWLGWQGSIVRERKRLLARVTRDHGAIFFHESSELPVVRRLMGDSNADWIIITRESDGAYGAQLRNSFPGCQINVVSRGFFDDVRADPAVHL
jgi:hypothetical protein